MDQILVMRQAGEEIINSGMAIRRASRHLPAMRAPFQQKNRGDMIDKKPHTLDIQARSS